MSLWSGWRRPNIDELKRSGNVSELTAALHHREAAIRFAAAVALAESSQAQGVRSLLLDTSREYASESLDALARLARSVTSLLVQALEDPAMNVRHRAAWALSTLKADGPVERVVHTVLRDRLAYLCNVYEDRCGMPVEQMLRNYGELAAAPIAQAREDPGFDQAFITRVYQAGPGRNGKNTPPDGTAG
ncbi:hypothetical protein AYO40_01280 [Planctomycetaceae bacterium SCGC AG-212-D15]|nr:hypothetical protein AYO40_01280 [Planctomycetaceae bacterium SCGC AG-212-D15]